MHTTTHPNQDSRLDASDRLSLMYASPGPYVSVFLQTRPLIRRVDHNTTHRWAELRSDLVTQGAPTAALDAIDARLGLPHPPESAAVAIIAAADGTTVVDYALEPPRQDLAVLETLPYAAPLIEWDQRRVPHLVVVVDDEGADIVSFGPDDRTDMIAVDGADDDVLDAVRSKVADTTARLVVVGGEPERARQMADALVPRVGPNCNVVAEIEDTADAFAEATVRRVADSSATATVEYLREFRFLAEHGAAVDGLAPTLEALKTHTEGVLLIHDDPEDDRRVLLGDSPTDLTLVPDGLAPVPDAEVPSELETARFVDAAIRAAIAHEMRVQVIPSTGRRGPDGGAAHLDRSVQIVDSI